MKKKILMGLAALALVSCNNDDDNNNAISGVNLDKVYFKLIDSYETDEYVFEDNKMIKSYSSLSANGTYNLNFTYSYGSNGQLSGVVGSNSEGETFFERTITYDSQGRIATKHEVNYSSTIDGGITSQSHIDYIYNDEENTITADLENSVAEDKTYYLNEQGLVYKVVSAGGTQELTYSGNDIVAFGDQTFSYLDTPVKGQYLNMFRNSFSSQANFVVYNGYFVPSTLFNKYVEQSEFEFNDEGYPIKEINDAYEITIAYK